MLALLSILLALALLGLTVYALHRYQTMEFELNVERSAPLPPLRENIGNPLSAKNPETGATKPAPQSPVSKPVTTKAVKKQPKSAPSPSVKSWQDSVAKLKTAGKYQEAVELCEQQMPLWSAYNQLCMLIRAEIKEPGREVTDHYQLVAKLYSTAAIAEFLHDKSEDSEKLTNQQLRKLDLGAIAALEFPYSEIGYAHLRLIRKSDIKHMVELWGRPANHRVPREHHAAWWREHVKS